MLVVPAEEGVVHVLGAFGARNSEGVWRGCVKFGGVELGLAFETGWIVRELILLGVMGERPEFAGGVGWMLETCVGMWGCRQRLRAIVVGDKIDTCM